MHRLWLALGALAGLLAVGLSAWAAHGLSARLEPARLAMVQSALTMQGWHALALVGVSLLAERRPSVLVHAAGAAFALGMALFCGAVWAAAVGGVSLGPVAPTGGTALMLGWALLALSAFRR